MKKISLLLALVMLLSAFSFSAFAADDASAVIGSATAKAGDEVTLSLTFKNSPGIAGAQLYIGYDSDVMTYVSGASHSHSYTGTVVEADGTEAGYTLYECSCGHSYKSDGGVAASFYTACSTEAGANPVKVVIANLSLKEVKGDFAVADITFKISDTAAAGEYDVSISAVEAYDSDVASVAFGIKNGSITVKGSSSSSATVHKHSYKTTVVAPSGTEPGYTLYKCSCGHSYKGDYVYDETVDAPKFAKQRDYTGAFVDVTESHWFYKFVKTAYEYKLANGTSETKFSPDNKFTVAQALTAAVNIHTAYNGTSVRAAADGEAWYVPYVEYCTEYGIIADGQFANYDANITRGDMAIVFANILPESEYEAVRSVTPSDVVEEGTVYPAYKLLYEAGIVSGDAGTGNFRPDDEIVRSEACVIFTRIAVTSERAK
ncbi:MAG: S-layer homology domain-containing protein [Clostridia bacterium]|nr:S-layer homology domain-containing protein [Clostridia bacterium]